MICLFHLNCSFHCLLTWRSVNLFLKHKWQLSWILFYFCAMCVRNTVVVRNRILPFFFLLELVWKNFLLFYLQTATDLCVWIVCCGFFVCWFLFIFVLFSDRWGCQRATCQTTVDALTRSLDFDFFFIKNTHYRKRKIFMQCSLLVVSHSVHSTHITLQTAQDNRPN